MSKKPALTIIISRSKPKTTKVFDTYWHFAAERQSIFFRRLNNNESNTWTEDPILSKYKFTNTYRASDRVSQYLIKNVIYNGDQTAQEVFFRTILFKLFNRIETWELLERELGEIKYSDYLFEDYDRILNKERSLGKRIYSAAYIMPSGSRSFGYNLKHRNNLKLLERMMNDNLPYLIKKSKTMEETFNLLRSYPTIGDFLAYQYVIDLNYSNLTDFSENDFVAPGPGALSGIKKCFSSLGDFSERDIIKLMVDSQEDEFRKQGLEFKSLWGRPLKLIDCQNLFCEVDKYSRVKHPEITGCSNRIRIKQQFKKTEKRINYWYPPKWRINHKIENCEQSKFGVKKLSA